DARRLTGDASGAARAYQRAAERAEGWSSHPDRGPWARLGRALALLGRSLVDSEATEQLPQLAAAEAVAVCEESRGDLALASMAQYVLARATWQERRALQAIEAARAALAGFVQLKWPQMISRARYVLGVALRREEQLEEAEQQLLRAAHSLGTLANPREQVAALRGLAALQSDRGDHAGAKTTYARGLDADRRLGNRPMEIYDLCNLGEKHRCCGELSAARSRYGEALVLARRSSNRRMEALALAARAALCHQMADLTAARAGLQRALALCGPCTDPEFSAKVLGSLCAVESDAGDLDAAAGWHEHLIRHVGSDPPPLFLALIAESAGRVAFVEGRAGALRAEAVTVLGIGKRTSRVGLVAQGWSMLAMSQQLAQQRAAEGSWRRALELFGQIQELDGQAASLCGIAEVRGRCLGGGDCAAFRAEALCRRAGLTLRLVQALAVGAQHAAQCGDGPSAVERLAEAEALAEEISFGPCAWLPRRLALARAAASEDQVGS
ncbi:MAG: hypothetical protein KTR31_25095, partial [Myxococcales bacterium]|nr:hypothetical protein [Myxococcales bacterium]